MKKFMAVLLIGASLFGLAGCCTFSVPGPDGYDRFYDTNGEYRLVQKNNDVWIEKTDGTEKRQISHSPDIREDYAFFVNGSKCIVYDFQKPFSLGSTSAIIVPFDKDDSAGKRITWEEFIVLTGDSNRKSK